MRESAKKVLKEYYGYDSERDAPEGLAAVLEDWRATCLHRDIEDLQAVLDEKNVTDEWRLEEIRAIISLKTRELQAATPPTR